MDFKFSELSEKQKKKLLKFYCVKSLDELELLPDGNIVKKLSGKGKSIKFYLQDRKGVNYNLSIEEFLKKQKNPSFGLVGLDSEKAKSILEKFFETVAKDADKELQVLVIEQSKGQIEGILFQQFITFYSEKLRKVLCGGVLNKKFIRATGNPAFSDIDFYNIYKLSETEVVIKGFAFATFDKSALFLDTVCGSGGSSKMILDILEAVKEKAFKKKPKYIKLESIETPNAINFYSKLGFRKVDSETKKVVDSMIKSNSKTFKGYSKKYPTKAGGELYLFPTVELQKKFKAGVIYNPELWFNIIKEAKKEGKDYSEVYSLVESKFTGSGIGSFFSGIKKRIISKFSPKLGFTNQSLKTLGEYGNWVVKKIEIQKTPIMGILDRLLNFLSFGTFQKAKEKYGYDKLFHLQLGVTLLGPSGQVKKVVLEKNETVDITVAPSFVLPKNFLSLSLPVKVDFTLNQLVYQTLDQQGPDTFFRYDPFTNNCQFFIRYLLESRGLYSEKARNFLFQDLTEFTKELPSWLPWFSRKITDLGATISNLRGKGEGGKNSEFAKQKFLEKTKKVEKERDEKEKAEKDKAEKEKAEKEKEEEETRRAERDFLSEARKNGVQEYNQKMKFFTEYQEGKRKPETKQEKLWAKELISDEERERRKEEDIRAYNEGRIDDIRDSGMRSRAQKEDRVKINNAVISKGIEDNLNSLDRLVNDTLIKGVDWVARKVPKVGNFIADVGTSLGSEKESGADKTLGTLSKLYTETEPVFSEEDYIGFGKKEGLELHAVIIPNSIPLKEAKEIAKPFQKGKKFVRETKKSFRFRVLPKTVFEKKSFRTKVFPNFSLVFGLKKKI